MRRTLFCRTTGKMFRLFYDGLGWLYQRGKPWFLVVCGILANELIKRVLSWRNGGGNDRSLPPGKRGSPEESDCGGVRVEPADPQSQEDQTGPGSTSNKQVRKSNEASAQRLFHCWPHHFLVNYSPQ